MEYAMLTMLIPQAQAEEYRRISKHTMQDAASALQQNLYDGLCANLGRRIPLFNVLPVSSFPQYCTIPFIRSAPLDGGGRNLGFCNIKLVRNRAKSNAAYKALRKWCQSTEDEKTLFVYTISQPFLAAVSKLKKEFPLLRVCAIVADLPNMSNLSSKKSFLLKWFSSRRAKESYERLPNVDAFVLLTKHMADYMHLRQPYCVMEGIAPDRSDRETASEQTTDEVEKIILYTGTLHKKFGVLHLLDAFRIISDPNVRLVICGIGDSEETIREASMKDSRIDFRGQLHRDEVLELQKKAAVLVNPRLNNEEFTKYSFPSKTLEYLSSGAPVIAYKLDGIPDEYDDYLIYPKDDTAAALASAITSVCAMDGQRRREVGEAGQNYVLTCKNALSQTKRILDFLSTLSNRAES